MKLARELYGKRLGQLAFVIGCGPSIKKAEQYLSAPHPHSFRIAINRAIESVPADYWFWIDGDSYSRSKDHPNAKAAVKLGVDHFQSLYSDDVYVWERAIKYPQDLYKLKVANNHTSLIGAIHMAALLGAVRVVTVGCDHEASDEYVARKEREEKALGGGLADWDFKKWRGCYDFTFQRINTALRDLGLWLPEYVSVADASGGRLPIRKTAVNAELAMLDEAYKALSEGRMKMVLGNAVGAAH